VTAVRAVVATQKTANPRLALSEDFVDVCLVQWMPMSWMTRGKMNGLLHPEPVDVVKGTSIDASPKMMPVLQAPVYVLTRRESKWLEHESVTVGLRFFLLQPRSLLSVDAEGGNACVSL